MKTKTVPVSFHTSSVDDITLAVWGRNDPFFLPAGAEAFRRDNSNAKVIFFDTGHFALETYAAEIGQEIGTFLRGVFGEAKGKKRRGFPVSIKSRNRISKRKPNIKTTRSL